MPVQWIKNQCCTHDEAKTEECVLRIVTSNGPQGWFGEHARPGIIKSATGAERTDLREKKIESAATNLKNHFPLGMCSGSVPSVGMHEV